MSNRYAVIMAGGKGERFWPLSTSKRPKQLLSLVGDKTLLAQSADRLEGLIDPENVFVLTNKDLVEAAREAAPNIPPENIIGEPVGRDTAPAVALGTALIKARDPKGVFCVLTADHVIGDLDLFKQTLADAMELAEQNDMLLTIGIQPSEPSTGFGYIESGDRLDHAGEIEFRHAKRFVEKPDGATAQTYVDSGRYFWNSGMFVWSVASVEKAFSNQRPQLSDFIQTITVAVKAGTLESTLDSLFSDLEKISIDYAIMEGATNIVMAKGVFSWDDVGAWPALENHFEKDAGGNVIVGDGATYDSNGNIIVSRDRLTGVVGLKDVIVVQAEGVTLVCPKDRAQDIKKLVEQLKADNQHQHLL